MATFYVTWELLHTRLVTEEVEAKDFDEAESQTRARFASGLVSLTEALGPTLADDLADAKALDEIVHAKLRDNLGPTMAAFVRVLVPSHQITRVAVATAPITKEVSLTDFLPPSE